MKAFDLGRRDRLARQFQEVGGNFHRRARPADGFEYARGLKPEQVPCLSHSLKISPGAGIRSSIEVMMLRSSRGAGRWQ